MTSLENETLVCIATALGYKVQGISPAYYGTDFGRLELLDEKTGHEFPWNPITHAGDRYKLIKAAGMMVNFAEEGKFATVVVPMPGSDECKMLQFSKVADEQVEAMAIISVAHAWASAKLALLESAT